MCQGVIEISSSLAAHQSLSLRAERDPKPVRKLMTGGSPSEVPVSVAGSQGTLKLPLHSLPRSSQQGFFWLKKVQEQKCDSQPFQQHEL